MHTNSKRTASYEKGGGTHEETHVFNMYLPDFLLPDEYSGGKWKRHMGLYFSQTDEAGKLQVHFLDVGQGDSMLIQTPSHYNILVDGGDGESGEKVISELSARGVKKLDLLVATHPDIDHIGGLLPVLEKFKVKQVLDSGKLYTTRTYQRYTEILAEKQIPVTIAKEGSYITVGSASITSSIKCQSSKSNEQSGLDRFAADLSYSRLLTYE